MKRKHLICHLLSFLLPAGIVLLIYAINGKCPFGSGTMLDCDAGAQYYPFFLLFRRTVRQGGSLLYSWAAGMGSNFWALLAYYCLNPWNLIGLLLPDTALIPFFSLSICFRLGLAGLFFSVLLRTVRPENTDLSNVVFSLIYALNAWLVSNQFQLIWLDTVILTPLVLSGLILLVRDRKPVRYVAVLCLSLFCSPYMSFITCCMTGLCWIGLLIVLKKKLRELPRETGRFLGCSVLAAGIAAVSLVPMAFALTRTASPAQFLPPLDLVDGSLPAYFTQMIDGTFPIMHTGLPNISAGMLAVILLTGYLTARRIPLRERIVTGMLFLFLMVSLWYVPLNYVWHGLHIPNGFVHRFAHLVPLVTAFMGWRYVSTWDAPEGKARGIRFLQIGCMTAVTAGWLYLADLESASDVLMVSVLFAALYSLVLVWLAARKESRGLAHFVLLLLAGAEAFVNLSLVMQHRGADFTVFQLTPRPEIEQSAALLRGDAEKQQQLLYRTALHQTDGMSDSVYNKALLYDLASSSEFYSSLIPAELCGFCGSVGMDSEYGVNYYLYSDLSPLAALMISQQYVISPDGEPEPPQFYRRLGDSAAYAFRYLLPAGFCLPEKAADSVIEGSSYPERQNQLFRSVSGYDESLFRMLPAASPETNGTMQAEPSADKLHCTVGTEKNGSLILSYTADADGYCIFDLQADVQVQGAVHAYYVSVDGKRQIEQAFGLSNSFEPFTTLHPIGQLKKGQEIQIELHLAKGTESDVGIAAAILDEAVFERFYQKCTEERFQVTACSGRTLTGTVNAERDTMLYLSVPYDKGWHVTVDGVSAETVPLFDAMTGVPMQKGVHEIRMRFIPQGMIPGAAICAGSLLCAAVMLILFRNRRNNQKSEC